MTDPVIFTVQFENASNDQPKNLASIRRLATQAKMKGRHAVTFHECSLTGYTFASKLSKSELLSVAETLSPPGPSIQTLCQIAKEIGIIFLAGFFEQEASASDAANETKSA